MSTLSEDKATARAGRAAVHPPTEHTCYVTAISEEATDAPASRCLRRPSSPDPCDPTPAARLPDLLGAMQTPRRVVELLWGLLLACARPISLV